VKVSLNYSEHKANENLRRIFTEIASDILSRYRHVLKKKKKKKKNNNNNNRHISDFFYFFFHKTTL